MNAPIRHRLAVASRALAAIGGGYAVAALSAAAIALWWPASRAEAVLGGTLASFLVFAGAAVWVFAARSAARAWLGLAAPALLLGALVWLRYPGSPA